MNSQSIDGGEKWELLNREGQQWIHKRFDWLIATFGIKRLWNAPILTLCHRDFPDPYSGTEADVEVLFSRICRYMELDVNRLKLRFYSREDALERELAGIPSNAAGLYQYDLEKPTVWLDRAQLANSEMLIAIITHELCHEILLGQKLLDVEKDLDHERVTDLLTIFIGMGVFTGNSYLPRKRWFQDSLEYSNSRRLGYLKLGELAHSLALMAWYRYEPQPDWLEHLNPKLRDLVLRHLARLMSTKGVPSVIPDSLASPNADLVRSVPTDALVRPEVVVPEYETDDYETTVKCVCYKCRKLVRVSVEFAGLTASCPLCEGYVNVPELSGGKRAKTSAQWNIRRQRELNWQHHKLSTKWAIYFTCAGLVIWILVWLLKHQHLHPMVVLPFMFGTLIGVGFTIWWYNLKELENSHPNPMVPTE